MKFYSMRVKFFTMWGIRTLNLALFFFLGGGHFDLLGGGHFDLPSLYFCIFGVYGVSVVLRFLDFFFTSAAVLYRCYFVTFFRFYVEFILYLDFSFFHICVGSVLI